MTDVHARAEPIVLATAAAIAALAVCVPSGADDWPQWLGPGRDSTTCESVTRWPPRELWRTQVGLGYSSIVVEDGRVFTMGHDAGPAGKKAAPGRRGTDTVYCLDARSGEVLWKHAYDCLSSRRDKTAAYPGPRATPAVHGGAVYTLSLEGLLLSLDVETGAVVWSANLPKDLRAKIPFYGYCSSPLVHDGLVILEANAPGASYVGFDARTGEVVWRAGDESAETASPVLARSRGRTVALFVSGKALVGLDAAKGEILWRADLDWTTWMGAVVSGEYVFVSSASLARGCAVFRFGDERPLWWARRKYQALHCNAVIRDGHVYGSDNTRTDYQYHDNSRSRLKCIELATGEVKWTLKGVGWANVVMTGAVGRATRSARPGAGSAEEGPGRVVRATSLSRPGRLLVFREGGELVLMEVSPAGYREAGRAAVIEGPCWTVPALARGRAYFRNNEGTVVCVDVGGE